MSRSVDLQRSEFGLGPIILCNATFSLNYLWFIFTFISVKNNLGMLVNGSIVVVKLEKRRNLPQLSKP